MLYYHETFHDDKRRGIIWFYHDWISMNTAEMKENPAIKLRKLRTCMTYYTMTGSLEDLFDCRGIFWVTLKHQYQVQHPSLHDDGQHSHALHP